MPEPGSDPRANGAGEPRRPSGPGPANHGPPAPGPGAPDGATPAWRGPMMTGPRGRFGPGRGLRPPKPLPLKPRKVRGGVKLRPDGAAPGSGAWASQRWIRLLEEVAPGPSLVEGLEYARQGQTRRLTLESCAAVAHVQGRQEKPYQTRLTLPKIGDDAWPRIVQALAESASFSAKLLSGEVPPTIEEAFAPVGERLIPLATDLVGTCTCGGSAWCKHVCCVGYLIADRLATDASALFLLRGLDGEELKERLRARRASTMASTPMAPAYTQRIAGVSDTPEQSLDEALLEGPEAFWDVGDDARGLELPAGAPEVTHPLLRRLGPSPFTGASFPLVGLLASCYDAISERARAESDSPGAPPEPPESPESPEGPASPADAGEPHED